MIALHEKAEKGLAMQHTSKSLMKVKNSSTQNDNIHFEKPQSDRRLKDCLGRETEEE